MNRNRDTSASGAADPAGSRDWADRVSADLIARGIPGTLPAVDHAAGLIQLADIV